MAQLVQNEVRQKTGCYLQQLCGGVKLLGPMYHLPIIPLVANGESVKGSKGTLESVLERYKIGQRI